MKNCLRKTFGKIVASTCLGTGLGAGEIVVDGTAFWAENSNTLTGTFDASGSDKLVVVITGEHGFPNNLGGNVTSVTYDGVELTQAIDRNPVADAYGVEENDQLYNDIWFLDDPSTSTGEIVAEVATRGNVTVFGLSGTAPGVGATVISEPQVRSVDLTTTASGSYVISSFGVGGNGNTGQTDGVLPDEPLTLISAQESAPARNWEGHVVGAATIDSPGTVTFSFTGGDESGAHVIAAEFLSADGIPGGGLFQITDFVYSAANDEVTLTFPKTGAPSFAVKVSSDMIDWNSDLDDGVTDAADENTADADNITVTLPLPGNLQDVGKLFFRVEEGS